MITPAELALKLISNVTLSSGKFAAAGRRLGVRTYCGRALMLPLNCRALPLFLAGGPAGAGAPTISVAACVLLSAPSLTRMVAVLVYWPVLTLPSLPAA